MKEKGQSLQGLTLGGGEPLLQKGLLDMLRTLCLLYTSPSPRDS